MKTRILFGTLACAAVIGGALVVPGCGTTSTSTTSTAVKPTAKSAVTVLPVAKNPIVNDATAEGLKITSAMVENNVDPVTKKDISDRLQIGVKNTSGETLSDMQLFYQMTDSVTKKSEGYYQKLTGLSLNAGETKTVYFDTDSGTGHYPENIYSLYRTSANEVVISIEISAVGFKPAMGEVKKAKGTGEKAGE